MLGLVIEYISLNSDTWSIWEIISMGKQEIIYHTLDISADQALLNLPYRQPQRKQILVATCVPWINFFFGNQK